MRVTHGRRAICAVGGAGEEWYSRRMKANTISASHGKILQPFRAIAAGASIGHVHLKVADLERAIAFYRDALVFEVTERYGRNAAFLSAGGYHHHIGLNTWESQGGLP